MKSAAPARKIDRIRQFTAVPDGVAVLRQGSFKGY
jgi:hypothetical protein